MAQNRLKIALAQLNPIVGDVAGNEEKARSARAEAVRLGADIVMFTELYLAGYPTEDLVLKPAFQDACRAALERLARAALESKSRISRQLAAAVLSEGGTGQGALGL